LLLIFAHPATSATRELYLLGGVTMANLGGDADEFGDALRVELQNQTGTPWTSKKESRTGFDFGVGIEFETSTALGGAIELRYVTRGGKWDFAEQSGSGIHLTGTIKLDYFEIPALLQVTPAASGSVHPMLVVGPVLGIKTSSSFEASVAGQSQSQDISQGMKGTYVGVIIGAGTEVNATRASSFVAQIRFQPGLSSLVDDPNSTLKTKDFSFLVGWSIQL
jgi:opacity protein-like surface antigen